MVSYADFCKGSTEKWTNNTDAAAVFGFLCKPENIHNMIVMSKLGLPAISGIVKELEEGYSNLPDFLLSEGSNRQIVGKMVKYILGQFGYVPVANGHDERGQLRNFTGANLFKTASVYSLTSAPKCSLSIQVI